MKYNNYALALVLLASSAFASFKISTDQELIALAENVLNKRGSIIDIKFANDGIKSGIKNILSKNQFEELKIINRKDDILAALKKGAEKDFEGYVEFIFNRINEKTNTDEARNFYKSDETLGKILKLKELQNNASGRKLSKDEIKSFLMTPIENGTHVNNTVADLSVPSSTNSKIENNLGVAFDNANENVETHDNDTEANLLLISTNSTPPLDSDTKIKAILNPAAPAIDYEANAKLATEGKIDPKNKDSLMKHDLKPEQVDKLLAASGLDSEVKIKEVLKAATEKNKVTTNIKKLDSSPHTMPWLSIIAAILLVSAIGGGGAYMMTRKTDKTDL